MVLDEEDLKVDEKVDEKVIGGCTSGGKGGVVRVSGYVIRFKHTLSFMVVLVTLRFSRTNTTSHCGK